MNSRSHSNQPTFVFNTSDVACSVGRNMDRDGDYFMSKSYAFFDGNEKRVRNMTTYTLSVYHSLLRRQVVLTTMDCEAENQGNAEMFFKKWNDVRNENLDENAKEYKLNPTGILLDQHGCNWKALEIIYGKEFIQRCDSCEFHFKQSVNQRVKEPVFSSKKSIRNFKQLTKEMLEAQTAAQFNDAIDELTEFIRKKPKRKSLLPWLKWWVA